MANMNPAPDWADEEANKLMNKISLMASDRRIRYIAGQLREVYERGWEEAMTRANKRGA